MASGCLWGVSKQVCSLSLVSLCRRKCGNTEEYALMMVVNANRILRLGPRVFEIFSQVHVIRTELLHPPGRNIQC